MGDISEEKLKAMGRKHAPPCELCSGPGGSPHPGRCLRVEWYFQATALINNGDMRAGQYLRYNPDSDGFRAPMWTVEEE